MKTKLIMLVIAVMAMTNYTNAQVIYEKLLNDELYHARVKLVDEFFDRFNLKEYHPNLDTTLESFKTDNIIVLFDYESFKQDKNLFPMAVDFAKKLSITKSISITATRRGLQLPTAEENFSANRLISRCF